MEGNRITSDDIKKLGHNIQTVYKFFHPNGLEESVLAKKAAERNFYRVIYQHYKQETEAK